MSNTLPTRRLGQSDLNVSSLGLGCMGMSFAYGPADEGESLRVLHRYFELGGNFLDTAEMYGPYENEKLIGRFLKEHKGPGRLSRRNSASNTTLSKGLQRRRQHAGEREKSV